MSSLHRLLRPLAALSLFACANAGAQVVISQVYGGGGNSGSGGATYTHDFVELFNRGTTSQSLNGHSIQYASATGTSWNATALGNVTLAPGQYYLVQLASGGASGIALPTPDASGSANMSATGGKVAFASVGTPLSGACPTADVLDFVGFGGANCFETGAAASGSGNQFAYFRAAGGCTDTGNNTADFATATPSARNTSSALNPCTVADTAPAVLSTSPADDDTGVPVDSNLLITFTEPVNVSGSWFLINCESSGPISATVTGGPTTFTLNPDDDFLEGDTCIVTVFAPLVTDVDSNDPPDEMASNYVFSFEVLGPGPVLHIGSTSLVEGDSGTLQLVVPVSLVNAASGPFSVTYSTADGSATQPADYLPASGTLNFSGAADEQQTFIVEIVGDIAVEGNETFSASLGTVSGASVAIGTGTNTLTITDNDTRYPIWQIQGSGAFSPLTSGATIGSQTFGPAIGVRAAIVTAISYRASDNAQQGFFIQSPSSDADGSDATSEGLYVFGTNPVAVGDLVEVNGTVKEHFGMTEIVSVTAVNIVSNGNALPAPVEFSSLSGLPSTDPAALSCPNSGPGGANNEHTNFECFEAMRVSVPEAIALQGSFRRADDTYSEFQFRPRATRALREAGLKFPQAPGVGNAAAPMWDGNPEVLEIDPDIARRGHPATLDIDTQIVGGARFSAVGPLIFDFGDYVLWPNEFSVDVASNVLPRPVSAPLSGSELSVGSFNAQHLCDDDLADDCERDTPGYPGLFGFTPFDYATKLERVSAYVRDVLGSPDVLGVQEVDTQDTLQALGDRIEADGGPAYTAYLVEGSDPGGIDVGFLVRDDRITDVAVEQFFLGDTWPDPAGTDILHDRPPLLLRANFRSTPGAAPFPIAVLNNHTKARSQVDNLTADAERDRAKRFRQARDIASVVQQFQTGTGAFAGENTGDVPLILVGDYNAYQFTDGRVDVLGLIAGTYDDAANECNAVLSGGAGTETCNLGVGGNIVAPPLQNLVLSVPAGEQFSYLFAENLGSVLGYGTPNPARDVVTGNVLDHILVNQRAEPYVSGVEYGRANHDMSVQSLTDNLAPDGNGATQGSLALRSSDHDGLVAYFETDCSNLAITPGQEPDPDGDGICSLIDNCPIVANPTQLDSDGDGLGDACDANTAPTISDIADLSTDEDTAVVVNFTIGDADSPLSCTSAHLTAASGNAALVPVSGIVFGGTVPACSATITPADDLSGTSTLTFSVSDGLLDAQDSFVLTVTPVDDGGAIANDDAGIVVTEDSADNVIDVLANDDADPDDGMLTLASVGAAAHGTTVIVGSTIQYTPAANYCGSDSFSYIVNGGDSATVSIDVSCINDAPTITALTDLSLNESGTASQTFTIADVDSTLDCGTSVQAVSDNLTLLPVTGIALASAGTECQVTVEPVDFETGVANVTLTVSDGALQASEGFAVNVIENDADNDGVADGDDNCPTTPNPGQEDGDDNGIGDACEPLPDAIFADGFED